MKGLGRGDRVRTRGQQYYFALQYGTGTIIGVKNRGEDYLVRHDANTRIGCDGVTEEWHPQHCILQADYQFRDTEIDYVPFVNVSDGVRLKEIGYTCGVHYRLWADHYPVG